MNVYYSSCGRWAFVVEQHGTRPLRFVRVHPCVCQRACPACGAEKDRPCRSKRGGEKSDVCYLRRRARSAEPPETR